MGWGKPCSGGDCGCSNCADTCCNCEDDTIPTCTDSSDAVCNCGLWNCEDGSIPTCGDSSIPNCISCPCCVGGCGYALTPSQYVVTGLGTLFMANNDCDVCTSFRDPLVLTRDTSGGYYCEWDWSIVQHCDSHPFILPARASLFLDGCEGGQNAFIISIGGDVIRWEGFSPGGTLQCCNFDMTAHDSVLDNACVLNPDPTVGQVLHFRAIPPCNCDDCCADRPIDHTMYWDWDTTTLVDLAAAPCDTQCLRSLNGRIILKNSGGCVWTYTSGSLTVTVTLAKIAGICTLTGEIKKPGCFDLTYQGEGSCAGAPNLDLQPGGTQICCNLGVDVGCDSIPPTVAISFPCPPINT